MNRVHIAHLGIGLLICQAGHHDDIIAVLPVDGRRDAVLGRQLQRVDHPQDLHI